MKRLNAFIYAWKGLSCFFRSEFHAKLHAFATAGMIGMGILFQVNHHDWALLFLVTGLVWTAEIFNTAVERIVDFIHPGFHPQAGRIKDISAAAVLISALTALIVAAFIFIPKIFE